MGHVLDCTQQLRHRVSYTVQSASRECPNGAVWYITQEWAAFHTLDFFMPLDGFTSRPGCEAPVSTFTTIIPFISIKVSITGQGWDQINGLCYSEILYAHIVRREKRHRRWFMGNEAAIMTASRIFLSIRKISTSNGVHMCRRTRSYMCLSGYTSL